MPQVQRIDDPEPRTVVYVINVDWFFVSHFLHLARSAMGEGRHVIVAAHCGPASRILSDAGIEILALPTDRREARRFRLWPAINVLSAKLAELDDPIVHGFGQYGIVTGTFAARRANVMRRVFSVTGRGYSATSNAPHVRLLRYGIRAFCRRFADNPHVWWTAENRKDVSASGLARPRQEARIRLLGGAGIDPDLYPLLDHSPKPPLRLGLVSRLVWSKGIDIAAEAVRRARADGIDVTLSIAGQLDPGNPRALTEADMIRLTAIEGVTWHGRVDDIPGFWRDHHVALLPSRGGEGIPRSLIEAAACGRPIITSSAWGCAEFASETHGWTSPVNDVRTLARVIGDVASASDLEQRGRHARAIVIANYTEAAVWSVVRELYDRMPSDRRD